MSLNGLYNTQFPLTLDGTTSLDVSSLTIDGQNVDLTGLVPYVGATQTLNMGSQNIQTTHVPVALNDVINLDTLTNAVTFVDNSVALTYLNKITTSSQTVAGQVTFNKPVIINDSLTVNPTKTANLASVVDVSPNYKRAETDASVTANYAFGSITNSGGVYTATTTDNFATLGLANLTANKLYKISIYVRALPTTFYTTSIQLYSSADGITPVLSLDYSAAFIPTSTTFQLITGNFVIPVGYTKLILLCINTNNPTYVTPVEWYGLELFDMGVALTNASMPSQTADRVLVLNTNKQVVASGINTTKLGYLDNVSSDIQTQLNSKASTTYVDSQDGLRVLKTGDTMTGTLIMGGNKITTSYTPVNADDLTRKGYVDSAIAAIGSNYLPLTGGTMAGNITMNGNGFIGTINISSSLNTTPLMKWASLANHITGGASEAYLFNGVNGYIAVARNTTRSATEANLHMGSVGADCSIESIASDGSAYLPMGYYGSYHYFNNKLGIGTTNMPLTGINFSNNGTGLNWGLGYSRILDDGDLRICTDDNMRFYSGSSTSTYGTQQMLLNSSGLSMNNTLYANSGVVWDTYGDNRIYNGNADNYSPGTTNNNLLIKSWWGIGFQSFDGAVRINMNTRNGDAYFQGRIDIGGTDTLRLTDEGTSRRIQSYGGKPLHINPIGNDVEIGSSGSQTLVVGNLGVGITSNARLNIKNPSAGPVGGQTTHFGWTDNNNYIRGNDTYMDTQLRCARDIYYDNPPAQYRGASAGYGALMGWDVINKNITVNVVEYYHSGPNNSYQQVNWNGMNRTSQFYKSNQYQCLMIIGHASAFRASSAGWQDIHIRLYNQSTGVYYYYSSFTFYNVTSNHQPIDVNINCGQLPAGWYDTYTYFISTGQATDFNDVISLTYQLWPNGITSG